MEYTKELDCGCCGAIFRTWQGYKDQDQDKNQDQAMIEQS